MAALFEIWETDSGKFKFNLLSETEDVLLASQIYSTYSGAENGIESIRKNSTDDECYEKLTASNGTLYFVLYAGNNQIIGTSPMYQTEADRDAAIAATKAVANAAPVKDLDEAA